MSSMRKEIFLLAVFLMLPTGTTGQTAITGLSVPAGGQVPARMEIRDHIQNYWYRQILLVGMDCIQTRNRDDLFSHRRMAAIHGSNLRWNNDNNGGRSTGNGYCPHGNILFLPWHRPYLAMYEQEIVNCVRPIYNAWPPGSERDACMAALNTWRLPYWDWAQSGPVPEILGTTSASQTVTVRRMQNGAVSDVTMKNPLYSYPLQPAGDSIASISGGQNVETVRQATRQSNTLVSQPENFAASLNRENANLRRNVEAAYETSATFTEFDSTSSRRGAPIESPHNTVHTASGGTSGYGGHMSGVGTAAFDPLFVLHHANVDRLFAIWQAIYPDRYFTGTVNGYTADSPLYPFRGANNQYWTSTTVRDTRALGYTYPETASGDRATAVAAIKRLYNADVSKRRKRNSATINRRDTEDDSDNLAQVAQARGDANGTVDISASYYKYDVRITISNGAADDSFTVCVFLCQPYASESNYARDPCYVGSLGVFSSPGVLKANRRLYSGVVGLTPALEDRYAAGELKDMKTTTVKDYLKNRLIWKIVGKRTADCDLDGLDIHIVKVRVDVPHEKRTLPYCGETTQLYKVA